MRTVVITGSASGIGLATAEILRDRGDRVIGVDLHDAEVVADLSTRRTAARPWSRTCSALSGGTIDAVVANAGLALPSPATVAVNYYGCTRHARRVCGRSCSAHRLRARRSPARWRA